MRKVCFMFGLLLAGSGCADDALAKPAGHLSYTLTCGGCQRGYGVYAPPGYAGKPMLPLVLVLHGGGGTGWGAVRDANWQQKADAENFLVAYPDGLAHDPSQPARFIGNPRTWNDGSGRFVHGGKAEPVDDVAFLDAALDKIIADYAVDEKRIYVTGFSNGASMTFRFAGQSRRRIAAIAPVAGACWNPGPKLAHPVPMCYVTGEADPLNPLGGGTITLQGAGILVNNTAKPPVADSITRWCNAMGAEPAPVKREVLENGVSVKSNTADDSAKGKEVVYVTVPGLGHYWPGGARNLPEAAAGPFAANTFDATGFIWKFFVRHPCEK